jgi:hypothetical protein
MDWIWMDRIDVLCGLDRFLLEAPGAPVAIPKLESIGLDVTVFFDLQFKIPSFDAPLLSSPLLLELSSTVDITYISIPVLSLDLNTMASITQFISVRASSTSTNRSLPQVPQSDTLSSLLSPFTLILAVPRFSNQMSFP